jgi:hypothetical protein
MRRKADVLEHTIEAALRPGCFVAYGESWSFVTGLEEVAARIGALAGTEPARAAALYETFLAGCHEKAEEVDDSGGVFGQFVEALFLGWVKARRAAGADPDETSARLLAWMEEDPYGFCHGLEKELVRMLDRRGLAAFGRQVRERFDAVSQEPAKGGSSVRDAAYRRRRWGEVLRAVYKAQRNDTAYLALAEAAGLTPEDCHALATILVARRKPGEALAWVERGIGLAGQGPRGFMSTVELTNLRRQLLTKLGRGGEALEHAWAAYREHPSEHAYDELMELVAKADRPAWHEKAMEAAQDAELSLTIPLLLKTRELGRLAERLRRATDAALEGLSHFVTEPAASKLEKEHPELAARLWRAQGLRILNAGKSKYYDAALRNLERAQILFAKAGMEAEWARTVAEIRGRHHRKSGFISDFERLAAGRGPSTEPSFLERAKARWNRTESE